MEYSIDTSKPFVQNWSAKGPERILQNVFNLLNTWRYEVAYDRTLGMKTNILDKPQDVAVAAYTAEVYRLVSEYEPRARVKEVQFVGINDEGNMEFKVVLEI